MSDLIARLRSPVVTFEDASQRRAQALCTEAASTIERLTAERDAALGLRHAWPTMDVLTKLADATDHLLGHHGCDTHGHEEYRAAEVRAREIVAALAALSPKSQA